jgi:hypothetical protein
MLRAVDLWEPLGTRGGDQCTPLSLDGQERGAVLPDPYSPPSGFQGQFTLWNSNGLKHSWTEVKPVWRTRLLSDALVSQNERGLSPL